MKINDLLSVEEMTGKLIVLKDSREVNVDYIKFSQNSLKKIINAVRRNGDLKREDQDLSIIDISISRDDEDVFSEGQNAFEKRGDRYVIPSTPSSPLKFKGRFQTVFADSNNQGLLTPCEIEFGAISFDIHNHSAEYDDDYAYYHNISATIFPSPNHYKVTVIVDE